MGTSQEDDTEGGVRLRRIGEVLLHSNICGVVVWGGDLVVVGSNVSEAGGISCGGPKTCDKVERKKAEGRLMAEVDGR